MSEPTLFQFNNGSPISYFEASVAKAVDRANGVIRGVSLITGGVQARGHDLEVDDTTLTQMLECGMEKGQVPVKLNHQSGIENVCGYVNNFRIIGNKLLGDWFLLKSHQQYEQMMEKAERMPTCFGLSGAFLGSPQTIPAAEKGGKARNMARCTELLAVDCVTAPAANPGGLFSAKFRDRANRVDSGGHGNMPENPSTATLDDILAAIERRDQTIEQLVNQVQALQQAYDQREAEEQEAQQPLTREDLMALSQMSDDQLAAEWGTTRAEVHAALVRAGGPIVHDDYAPKNNEEGSTAAYQDSQAGDEAGAVTAGTQSAEGAALNRKLDGVINYLEEGVRQQEAAVVESAFQTVEQKITMLEAANREKDAMIDALQTALATGERSPLGSGVDAVNLFSAGENHSAFEQLVSMKTTELMAERKLSRAVANGQAVQFCIKNHPQAYVEFRSNPKGVTRL